MTTTATGLWGATMITAMKNGFMTAIAVGAISAVPAHAATVAPVSVKASSTFQTYDVSDLINGSGLSGNLHDGNFQNKWMSVGSDASPTLIFDLGRVFSLAGTTIWNYGGGCCGTGRNASGVSISTSLDNIAYSFAFSTSLKNETNSPFAGETFALNGSARYIRFNLLGNYGDVHTGLSEVRFDATAVPEPATWAMMTLGFGAMGFALRRRKVRARIRFA